MYVKGIPWAVLLSSYFHSIFCQNITFTSTAGITYDGPECGLEENTGSWSMNADVTIPNKTDFNPQIIVERGIYELCRVNLTTCPPASPPPATEDACYCTSNSGNDYSFLVRQITRKEHSQSKLTVTYRAYNYYINNIFKSEVIGFLPVMYGPPSAVYRMLGCHGREVCSGDAKKMPTESVTKTIVEKQVIQIEMCIYNLIDGVSTFNGIKSINACTERNIVMFIGPAGTTKQVAVTFKENGGCQRTGSFTLDIRAVVNSDAYGLCET